MEDKEIIWLNIQPYWSDYGQFMEKKYMYMHNTEHINMAHLLYLKFSNDVESSFYKFKILIPPTPFSPLINYLYKKSEIANYPKQEGLYKDRHKDLGVKSLQTQVYYEYRFGTIFSCRPA